MDSHKLALLDQTLASEAVLDDEPNEAPAQEIEPSDNEFRPESVHLDAKVPLKSMQD